MAGKSKSPAPRFDVRSLKGFHVLHGPHPWGKGPLLEVGVFV